MSHESQAVRKQKTAETPGVRPRMMIRPRLRAWPWTWRRVALLGALLFLAVIVALAVSPRLRLRLFRLRPAVPEATAAVPTANLFDIDHTAWVPGPYTFAPRDFTFRTDQIKRPSADAIERWIHEHPLVRPVPFPYFVGLSIPSDCCGSSLEDLYFSGTVMARKFGLDFPSSFWMYCCQPNDAFPAMHIADPATPRHGPIRLEGDIVDRFPLLLMYYYRGWLDHLHQWSAEAGVWHSLVTPQKIVLGATGSEAIAMQMGTVGTHPFQGLEIDVELDSEIKSFEIELIDAKNNARRAVYGSSLGRRSGWDLSAHKPRELRQTYLLLAQEQNSPLGSCLGDEGQPHLKAVRVLVHGAAGAALTVHLIRPIDVTRTAVQKQIENARAWNLLPICLTNHGGNSSWTQLDPWNYPLAFQDPATGQRFSLERTPLGSLPSSPSYSADLLSDFGVIFHNQTAFVLSRAGILSHERIFSPANLLKVWQRSDQQKMYLSPRWIIEPTPDYPDLNGHYEHFENLGGNIVRLLSKYQSFGQHWIMYTHFNYYNGDAFHPPENATVRMSQTKRLQPYLEQALSMLSCLKYDLDGQRDFNERVWCCPLSVALRYAQAQRGLQEHARLEGDTVRITPWRDEVTGKLLPDAQLVTQDLHGQTFYVPVAARARVFCGAHEITSLRRNPPDFTGRPSVSVVDTNTPTIVFDEAPLDRALGEVAEDGALVAYPRGKAARGDVCLEMASTRSGNATVTCKPFRFDNHETDFIRFFYRKTNPASEVGFRWTDAQGRDYLITEGSLQGNQGWEIGPHMGPGYREVVLEYADMRGPAAGAKSLPRGPIKQFRFELCNSQVGDVVYFDRVEFLSARGLRPTATTDLVVGGRLSNRQDHIRVQARGAGKLWEAHTEHGGWYFLRGIPRDSVVEISCVVSGRTCRPERGRLSQVGRNDIEYHIGTEP